MAPQLQKRWLECDNTLVLMRESTTTGIIKEWQLAGQVLLRQIYANIPPKWYAYFDAGDGREMTMIDRFDEKEDAQHAVETASTR